NGNEIKIHKDINISIAVAHENKLFVPVIKHADEKSIKGIAREINELAQKARNNKLTQEDMQGGTFTVNNTGSFGSVSSMGIINHPQAAILQVESIVKKPVVIDDMIAIRSMVNLCISIDHRILDGLQTGQFMNHIKHRVEQYTVENTNIY
ncbi:2-oxo acid dehydrogenase subunit E2, partial [Enterococcus faecalis]